VGDVVARIEPDGAGQKGTKGTAATAKTAEPASKPPSPEAAKPSKEAAKPSDQAPKAASPQAAALSPAVRKLVEENALDPNAIKATGPGGRITKEDVTAHLGNKGSEEEIPATPVPVKTGSAAKPVQPQIGMKQGDERVPMSRIRQRIAERLVQVQHTAAILTTFNEIDLSAVMEMRSRYKERFSRVHGVSLGFMSFFARAAIAALRDVPVVNASIDGTDIVHHSYVNLGIAVSTERGLVVPVIKNAHELSFAQIEAEIARLAGLARDGKLGPDDLSGGTFSITNGGVFGSLLSTPILNPPQSAILGMHKTEKRPVVVNDAVVVRPMMYVALSYDHRLIDGEQAVTFLVRIKERLEDPARLLLEV
jgi:2-oxoglutarate dehydrogenase E2 component (dihydrolipoamide succinyltransferase)